jgi:hypothetical protein
MLGESIKRMHRDGPRTSIDTQGNSCRLTRGLHGPRHTLGPKQSSAHVIAGLRHGGRILYVDLTF